MIRVNFYSGSIDTKENLFAITAVISYRFSFLSIKSHNEEEQFFLNVTQHVPSQVRTLIFFLFLGFYKELVHDTNDRRIPTCSDGGNRTRFQFVCLGGNRTHLLSVTYFYWYEGKPLWYHCGDIIEVFLCINRVTI